MPGKLSEALSRLKARSRALTTEVTAVASACLDRRTPLLCRILGACVAAYALSPIDLIPDFVPVLGYLDDLVILPLGVALIIRLMPPELMAEHRERAKAGLSPWFSRAGAALIVLLWVLSAVLAAYALLR